MSRQTLHSWLARFETEGLEGLVDRSHRPASCPHQMPAVVEAELLELRRSGRIGGPRRLVFELGKRGVVPLPSESAAYRTLVRAGMIDPTLRDRRSRKWKRFERGAPMELWQPITTQGEATPLTTPTRDGLPVWRLAWPTHKVPVREATHCAASS